MISQHRFDICGGVFEALTSLGPICSDIISGSHVKRSSPVSLRRRLVLRYKMFGELVSGSAKKRKTRQKLESHMSSQIVHCQPCSGLPRIVFAWTANPPTKGLSDRQLACVRVMIDGIYNLP